MVDSPSVWVDSAQPWQTSRGPRLLEQKPSLSFPIPGGPEPQRWKLLSPGCTSGKVTLERRLAAPEASKCVCVCVCVWTRARDGCVFTLSRPPGASASWSPSQFQQPNHRALAQPTRELEQNSAAPTDPRPGILCGAQHSLAQHTHTHTHTGSTVWSSVGLSPLDHTCSRSPYAYAESSLTITLEGTQLALVGKITGVSGLPAPRGVPKPVVSLADPWVTTYHTLSRLPRSSPSPLLAGPAPPEPRLPGLHTPPPHCGA